MKKNIFRAAGHGDLTSIVSYLEAGGDPNTKSETGLPLLTYAAEFGHVNVIEALLARGLK